ncbi:zinc finger CW-type PWWP domain protein 1 [Protobothrops mucrosquamatus]|uniref:zinc finger CW-type PWWP domain protein 1 n=1 Tax=Protobothrops mucrosquamatus TaxID=103944 RepID=UPI0010FB1FE4|nr:zinc finger CW-type PWWP domain protein 1 [Protobothrops mucrosquamatus]
MTSQSKKNECNKLPKRVFAPPVVKSYSPPVGKGEMELHGKPEDGVTAKSIINMLPVQSKRLKERTANVEKKSQCKKNLEMIENEKGCLTDAQFEEIVQSVLQKSPQECMDEKAAANNVGCKANRKREPKKAAQGGNAQDVIDPEEAPEEEEEEEEEEAAGGSGSGQEVRRPTDGSSEAEKPGHEGGCCTAWVQCSYPSCEKWRRLSSDVDPSALPEDWSCSQNPDLQYNSCSVPEEDWSGSENEVVYAIYFPGSIVWAKQYGYPWWPGIIEADPDMEEYFLFSSQADSLPSKYHVTFFGHSVTRAWISASQLKNYGEAPGEGSALAKIRNKSEKKDLRVALEMAKEAERISIQERIRRFGFHGRFRNKASPREDKILKEQNSSASRPPVKRAPETKGGNKNAAASRKNPEKLLREISAVRPNAKVKKTINVKGWKPSFSAPPQCETPRGQAPPFLPRQQQPGRHRRLSLAQPERQPEQV